MAFSGFLDSRLVMVESVHPVHQVHQVHQSTGRRSSRRVLPATLVAFWVQHCRRRDDARSSFRSSYDTYRVVITERTDCEGVDQGA